MSLVKKFAHLPNLPRSNEAGPLLEKIASQVKPIMAKRGWKVGTLGEFVPQNPTLLGININRGQRINLRLRPHDNQSTFYEYDQLVLVMLHELTHIVHGPHDASFYKLLAELEEEYYSLKHKGYSGEGFHSDGKKLNGLRVNEYEGKRRGLAAAEKRHITQIKLGRGGVLGGASVAGKSLREVLAEAAERRIKDDKTCKIDSQEAEEESRKAQEASIVTDAPEEQSGGDNDIVDLTLDDSSDEEVRPSKAERVKPHPPTMPKLKTDSEVNVKPLKPTQSRPLAPSRKTLPIPNSSATQPIQLKRPRMDPPRTAASSSAYATPMSVSNNWSCDTCTLLNPMTATACEACRSPRTGPAVTADGWFCEMCGAGPREMGYWSCAECGSVRKWG